jgi:hypothetical protein
MIEENKNQIEIIPEHDVVSTKKLNIGLLLSLGYIIVFPAIIGLILRVIFACAGYVPTESDVLIYNTVMQIGLAIAVSIAMFILIRSKLKTILKDMIKDSSIGYAILYLIAIFGVNVIYSNFIRNFIDNDTTANQEAIYGMFKSFPVMTFIFVSLLAPVIEELIFRYFVFNRLKKLISPITSIFITTLIFAAIHLVASIGTESLINDLKLFPMYLIPSFILTYSYYQTKKVAVPIMIHIGYNTFQAVLIVLEPLLMGLISSDSSVTSTIVEFVTRLFK